MGGVSRDATRSRAVALGWLAAGAAGYLLAVLALTFPTVRDPGTILISQWTADADHILWVQWWFARAIASADASIFHTPMLRFPETVNLHLGDVNLFVNAVAYPLERSLGAVGAYNAMLWASFLASAGLMWRLGSNISGDALAGWLSGLAFASSTYWIACALNSWGYLVHIWVFPLVLLAIARAARRAGFADFALAGVALGVVFHVTPYYFLFLGVLLLLLAPWYARDWAAAFRNADGALKLAVAAGVAACVVLPRAWPMIEAGSREYSVHSGPHNTTLAARPSEFFVPHVERPDRLPNGTFLIAFLGYTVPLLIAAGVALSKRRASYLRWGVCALVLAILALGPQLEFDSGDVWRLPGYWLMELPGFRFITNHWRWTLPVHFCGAIALALAAADLLRRFPAQRLAIAVGATVFLTAEVWLIFPFPHEKPRWSRPYDALSWVLREDAELEAVLDLRPRTKIRQLVHGKRILGGWLPRVDVANAENTRALMDRLRASGDDQPRVLHELGIGAVVVDEQTGYRVVRNPQGAFELRPLRADSSR
jgi:hypothetical protein